MEINKIYCMDNVTGMSQMPNESVDLVVTSPPYDDLRKYNGYTFDLIGIIRQLLRIIKPGGVIVWVVNDATIDGSETGTSFKQALQFMDLGFKLYDTMIYEKPPRGAIGSNLAYLQSFEYMFVFSKGRPKTINLICDRRNLDIRDGDNSTRRQKDGSLQKVKRGGYGEFGRRTNIWRYFIGKGLSTKDEIAFKHPAIFPELLVRDHIKSWSNEGDLILDPFMGSGTTAKVARAMNRNYIGFEISQEYVNIANQRLQETKTIF